MTQYEQKIKSYKNLNEKEQQKVINDENSLGYVVLSSSINDNHLTITFGKNKKLKYAYRLQDLENKIKRIDEFKNEVNNNLVKLNKLKRTKIATEKIVAWFLLFFIIIIDLLTVVSLTSTDIDLLGRFLWVITPLGFHFLHLFWLRSIKKRSSDATYKEAMNQLDAQSKVLYIKANNISKEIKEQGKIGDKK